MKAKFSHWILGTGLALCMCAMSFAAMAQEQDAAVRAENAVTAILFEADADEFTAYQIDRRGFVELTFASNVPDSIYANLVSRMKNHPDIKGVLAGKGGRPCRRF